MNKESSINSINTVIIPFLSTTYTNAKFEVIGNNHMTYLIISFENDDRNFNNIVDEFNQNYSFDSFEILIQYTEQIHQIKLSL